DRRADRTGAPALGTTPGRGASARCAGRDRAAPGCEAGAHGPGAAPAAGDRGRSRRDGSDCGAHAGHSHGRPRAARGAASQTRATIAPAGAGSARDRSRRAEDGGQRLGDSPGIGVRAAAWLCLAACLSCQYMPPQLERPFRKPGVRLVDFPEKVGIEFNCASQKLPWFKLETLEVWPKRLEAGKELGHRLTYVLCTDGPTDVVT